MLYAYNFINDKGKAIYMYTQFSGMQLPCFLVLMGMLEFKLFQFWKQNYSL